MKSFWYVKESNKLNITKGENKQKQNQCYVDFSLWIGGYRNRRDTNLIIKGKVLATTLNC